MMEAQRSEDLRFLNRYYESGLSNILVVYGHRNIEQSALLSKFTENRKSFDYSARSASEREQLFLWTGELKSNRIAVKDNPGYADIFTACADSAGKAPFIFIVRNFENIIRASKDFMELLVNFVKEHGRYRQILVLLVSSDINWVENSMVGSLGSHAADIAGFRKIKPLSFSSLRAYYPKMTYKDAVLTYSVLGGQTALWRLFIF